jgi:transcriptional activator for dhaKLM operon
MPVLVIGPEHFIADCHHLASAAAPIHDIRGRIAGIMAIVGPADSGSPHMLALVMAAARAISNQLHADWFLQEANLHLTEVNTVLGAISEGVIAWGESGLIHHANAKVAEILDLNPAAIVGRPLDDALELPLNLARAIRDNREVRDEEVTFRVNGQPITCLASLRRIGEGTMPPAGYIVMLRPIEQVRQLVHQQMGTQATLTLDDLSSQSIRSPDPGRRRRGQEPSGSGHTQ